MVEVIITQVSAWNKHTRETLQVYTNKPLLTQTSLVHRIELGRSVGGDILQLRVS